MKMKFTEDQLVEAETFGALGYDAESIFILMAFTDYDDFLAEFNNHSSEFARRYKKGAIEAQFLIDKMVYEQTLNGDFKALNEHKMRIKENEKKRKRQNNE